MQETFLICGLGNPGLQYAKTRHNIGFMCVDKIKEAFSVGKDITKFFGLLSSFAFFCDICDKREIRILLFKPQTFINISGRAVVALCSFYHIPSSHVFVLHDDIDISLGSFKFKNGGSSGGHNGLKSIIQTIGRDFLRMRIGIGRPENFKQDIAVFVLEEFLKIEKVEIARCIDCAIAEVFERIKTLP